MQAFVLSHSMRDDEAMCWSSGLTASSSCCIGRLYYFTLQSFAAIEAPHIYIKSFISHRVPARCTLRVLILQKRLISRRSDSKHGWGKTRCPWKLKCEPFPKRLINRGKRKRMRIRTALESQHYCFNAGGNSNVKGLEGITCQHFRFLCA